VYGLSEYIIKYELLVLSRPNWSSNMVPNGNISALDYFDLEVMLGFNLYL